MRRKEYCEMPSYKIGTFEVDVTIPVGHALCGGLVRTSTEIRDPLSARGFVISGDIEPIVYIVFDWCELRDDAYHFVRDSIAAQLQIARNRVVPSAFHPHDAPIFDLYAENLMRERGIEGLYCEPDFFYNAIQRVAEGVKAALQNSRPFTHIGVGQAKVEQVASNRRIPGKRVKLKAWRGSATAAGSPLMDDPEGLIDPYLKTILFRSEDKTVAAFSTYATHPMSYYNTGRTSADFCADARAAIQSEMPDTLLIYANGCAGNIAAGKYNNGTQENREALGARIATALRQSIAAAKYKPVTEVTFTSSAVCFGKFNALGVDRESFARTLENMPSGADRAKMESIRQSDFGRYVDFWAAAHGLSWLENLKTNPLTDITSLNIDDVHILALPGESFIQYQLVAQDMIKGEFVATVAYGDCGMGYIPVDSAWGEEGYEETSSYLFRGVESAYIGGIAEALGVQNYEYTPTEARKLPKYMLRWPYKRPSFVARSKELFSKTAKSK